jgi:hypothetical protein
MGNRIFKRVVRDELTKEVREQARLISGQQTLCVPGTGMSFKIWSQVSYQAGCIAIPILQMRKLFLMEAN